MACMTDYFRHVRGCVDMACRTKCRRDPVHAPRKALSSFFYFVEENIPNRPKQEENKKHVQLGRRCWVGQRRPKTRNGKERQKGLVKSSSRRSDRGTRKLGRREKDNERRKTTAQQERDRRRSAPLGLGGSAFLCISTSASAVFRCFCLSSLPLILSVASLVFLSLLFFQAETGQAACLIFATYPHCET